MMTTKVTSIAPLDQALATITAQPITNIVQDNVALSKFKLFPKLPIELRLKIWIAVPEPRIIVVEVINDASHARTSCKTHNIIADLLLVLQILSRVQK